MKIDKGQAFRPVQSLSAFALLLVIAAALSSQPGSPPEQVGPLPDGGFLLNSGWTLHPAGKQIPLSTFPMSTALSPDGKYLLVLNGGLRPPSISVISTAEEREIQHVGLADAWLGITFSRDGKFVYVGGGSRARVYELSFTEGHLALSREIVVVPDSERTWSDFIGDVAVTPDGHLIYAADLYHNQIVVINPQSGRVIEHFKTGRRPYRILFHPDGKSYFVTSWADGTLYHHKTDDGSMLGRIGLGGHPTDIVWSDLKPEVEPGDKAAEWTSRLFVTAANTNSVYVVGLTESLDMSVAETINVAMSPSRPLGMTPSALALSRDQKRLYVVCSDANAVAVADVSATRTHVSGFVPTGWYPTAARSLADGRLVVVNGKGLRSYANPEGPNPAHGNSTHWSGEYVPQYVPRMQTGSAEVIKPFNDEELEAYTKTAISSSPYSDRLLEYVETGRHSPIPSQVGGESPIQHVIYVIKENRTYDQVFGDLGKGNGEPSLTLFNADCTPNQRKIATEFVLFDNFYVNADVSADGHNWATAAIAPDYTVKMWPNSYAKRRAHYDYEGKEPANLPPAGYLWTNALSAGIPFRNYGEWVTNRKKPGPDGIQVETVNDPALANVTDMKYRGFDLTYSDGDRARSFLAELAEFEKTGQMPKLMIVRMGNDHTNGTEPGKVAPLSSMADNDYGLGLLLEGVSNSKFWSSTAMFVVEDDAQNGPDHVDSHRSVLLVASPYVRHGVIDSTMYNTASVLRTMELIVGLRPMTQFDAGARPLAAAFQADPDLRPYEAVRPKTPLDVRNPQASATAAPSEKMDFSVADDINDDELNDILWRAIRHTDPPAPVRSYFAK